MSSEWQERSEVEDGVSPLTIPHQERWNLLGEMSPLSSTWFSEEKEESPERPTSRGMRSSRMREASMALRESWANDVISSWRAELPRRPANIARRRYYGS